MTSETIIQKVREEVGTLDENGELLLAKIAKVLTTANEVSKPQASAESFVSRNISMEEYRTLPRSERRNYQSDAEERNRHWIEKQFKKLGANWIIVIDGQVVKHGANLGDYPKEKGIRELQQITGKCPFIFFSKFLLSIEENSTLWHSTKDLDDFYPALAMAISGNNKRVATEADLDTGAFECYSDLELLIDHGIVSFDQDDIEQYSKHLSQTFSYLTKEVTIELSDGMGISSECQTTIICVDNWSNSPFVAINPSRTFLLGRRVLLNLRPRVILDFDACSTEVLRKQ